MSDTVNYVVGSNGKTIPIDSLATTLAYNGDGTLNTETAVFGGVTYVKTYTYTAGKLTAVSAWVAQ